MAVQYRYPRYDGAVPHRKFIFTAFFSTARYGINLPKNPPYRAVRIADGGTKGVRGMVKSRGSPFYRMDGTVW